MAPTASHASNVAATERDDEFVDTEFKPDQDVTGRDWQAEDKEAARSEETGQIPRGMSCIHLRLAVADGHGRR